MSSQFPSRDLPQFLYVCKRTAYNFLLQVTYDQINMVLGITTSNSTMIYVLLKLHFLPEIQVVTLLQHLFGDKAAAVLSKLFAQNVMNFSNKLEGNEDTITYRTSYYSWSGFHLEM